VIGERSLFRESLKGERAISFERSEERFEKDVIEQLRWLSIQWDEGPDKEGQYGPYRQSKRTGTYATYIKKLLEEKKAYYCFCSPEELEVKRQEQLSRGVSPRYSGKCASLSSEQVRKHFAEGKRSVIRFRIPPQKVSFTDMIRGTIVFDTSLIGDFIIAKDVSTPLYNLSVVVDDSEMKITHVIRGQDLLSSTPKQILLQETFGFPRVEYGHLPLILGPDKVKLSKRHGAVSIAEYRKQGYLPETLVNFLAFLGWNPGGDKEIYTLEGLIRAFGIDKVQKSDAIFNIQKLDFLNGFYIRQKSLKSLTELCTPYLIESGLITPGFESQERMPNLTGYMGKEIVQIYVVEATGEKMRFEELQKIVSLYRQRLKKLSEIVELSDFFFEDTLPYEKDLLLWKEMTDKEIKEAIDNLEKVLSKIKEGDWQEKTLEKIITAEAETFAAKLKHPGDRGYLLWPLRVALTGKKSSAGPFEIAQALGKARTIKRVGEARDKLVSNK